MKNILLVLLATLTFSCATPEPQATLADCNEAWNYYDAVAEGHGHNWHDASAVNRIYSQGNIFRDRTCNIISKTTFESIDNFIDFIKEHQNELDDWTSTQREYEENKENFPGSYQQEWLGNDETKKRTLVEELALKKSVFNELRNKFEKLDKQAQYLIPVYFTKTKEWFSHEGIKEDEQKKNIILASIEIEKKNKVAEDMNDLADKENRPRPSILKMRANNPAQWKECKDAYKKYVGVIRLAIKENKRIPFANQEKSANKLKSIMEPLMVCRAEGYYTNSESSNIEGGAICLNFFSAMPSSAKDQYQCKDMMKPDSF